MAIKPSIPRGTRDFNPKQVAQRQLIIRTIREVFELYGFEPIETPAMEQLETLTGKYGEEGDRLLFKILNSGELLKGADKELLNDPARLASQITEKGLRYDLTVPLARYVVMHRNEITFPFKRYQIQPVWRADRPQKGRYREFWQCDADVIGSSSSVSDAELLSIYNVAFEKLGIAVNIFVNNRKVLLGLAQKLGVESNFTAFTILLDKLHRIGPKATLEECEKMGLSTDSMSMLLDSTLGKSTEQQLVFLNDFLGATPIGMEGVKEVERVIEWVPFAQLQTTLARGLDYYTGTIMEVAASDVEIGSIGGGGRYDDLTGVFGLNGVAGVGISFGLERINDVMEELGSFDKVDMQLPNVLITWFDQKAFESGWQLVSELRSKGIASDIYPEEAKMQKQLKYANAKGFHHVVIIGDAELQAGNFTVKNMKTGEQKSLSREEIVSNKLP